MGDKKEEWRRSEIKGEKKANRGTRKNREVKFQIDKCWDERKEKPGWQERQRKERNVGAKERKINIGRGRK